MSQCPITLAIDPGMCGAILVKNNSNYIPFAMPIIRVRKKGKGYRSILDTVRLVGIFRQYQEGLFFIERQAPFREQGFFGNASIMHSYGLLQGICAALDIRHQIIDPLTWRRALRLPAGKPMSLEYLARSDPGLAARVGEWPRESRIAVADCYCMLVAAQRLHLVDRDARADPGADWLE